MSINFKNYLSFEKATLLQYLEAKRLNVNVNISYNLLFRTYIYDTISSTYNTESCTYDLLSRTYYLVSRYNERLPRYNDFESRIRTTCLCPLYIHYHVLTTCYLVQTTNYLVRTTYQSNDSI